MQDESFMGGHLMESHDKFEIIMCIPHELLIIRL